MTDQQYKACKSNNIKIYKIWIQGDKLHKKLCSYEQFDKYYGKEYWINNFIPYDTTIQAEFMYATEDKLDQCKKKLITTLKKYQLRIIKEAQKKLESLEKIERKSLKNLDLK